MMSSMGWMAAVLAAGLLTGGAFGQQAGATPVALEGVGVTEHLGESIPLALTFVNEDGKTIKLADCFGHDKPVVLTLVYYRCPMLCGLVMRGLVDGLKTLPLTVGEDFDCVTISINPRETPALAKLNKQNVLTEYGRDETGTGWWFMTGVEANIRALAEAVGFGYRYTEEDGQYAHAAVVMVLGADGRMSRYLYGVSFEPKDLRLAILEAGQGKVGTTVDRFLMSCYQYDPESKQYTVAAMGLMRIGAVATLVALVGIVLVYRRSRRPVGADGGATSATGKESEQS